MNISLIIAWCVFVVLMTIAIVLGLRKITAEGYIDSAGMIYSPPKVFGAVSYQDKPNYVYVVDMNGGHEYHYDGTRLNATGKTKFLGTMIPLSLIDKIDAIAVDPTAGNFMHLIFSNAEHRVYNYNPSTMQIEHDSSYASHFGNVITNVVAAWQTPFDDPSFDYLFVYDGSKVYRLEFRNPFHQDLSRPTVDKRFGVIDSSFGGNIVGAAPIWSQNPASDLSRPVAIFGSGTYAILNTLEQNISRKLPYGV